jgi:apolipoprotein N-acyltransferase
MTTQTGARAPSPLLSPRATTNDDRAGWEPALLTAVRGGKWPGRLLAALAGALAAFAQPPWGFVPGLLGYGLMFVLADRAPTRRAAFARNWQVGVAYFIVSLWWLAEPFQVDAKDQGWMAPFAVLFTAMFMALFWGAAGATFRAVKGSTPLRVLLFAAALSSFEWLRGHILTGFPWDLPGASWLAGGAMSQIASVVGIYGLTWLTIAAAAALFVVAERRAGLATAAGAILVVAGLFTFGAVRLGRPLPVATGPLIRIVQADIRQETKYDKDAFASIVARYVRLTTRPAARRPDIVIWPEGAIPAAFDDYLAPDTWTHDAIANALAPGQTLILGGYRYGQGSRDTASIYNTQAVILRTASGLKIEAIYDKYRLVPFGEFMPLDSLASKLGIKALVHVGDGFSPGPRPAPLAVSGLPIMQPLICYEALYSGFTRAGAVRSHLRAAWIVNISNDAWFGTGIGPFQHLNLASYRAIEEGLPMVRATPTGISAVIDARGRLVPGESLGEGAMGVIDARLPAALQPTLFDLWGDGAFFAMLLISLAGAAIFFKRPQRRRIG